MIDHSPFVPKCEECFRECLDTLATCFTRDRALFDDCDVPTLGLKRGYCDKHRPPGARDIANSTLPDAVVEP